MTPQYPDPENMWQGYKTSMERKGFGKRQLRKRDFIAGAAAGITVGSVVSERRYSDTDKRLNIMRRELKALVEIAEGRGVIGAGLIEDILAKDDKEAEKP